MKKQKLLVTILVLTLAMALLAGCAQQTGTVDTGSILPNVGAIILRVNPEISVQYNEEGLVTGVEGLNDDGKAIVSGYDDYVGKDCKTVVRELVSAINDAGYFVEEVDGSAKSITIEIEPGSVLPQDDFLENIAADVQKSVAQVEGAGDVLAVGQDDDDTGSVPAATPTQAVTKDTGDDTDGPNSDGIADYNDTAYGSTAKPAPTKAPTAVPTKAPTAAPTKAPAAAPTKAPTAAPTKAPSGNSDYGDTNYGDTGYNDSSYGSTAKPAPTKAPTPAPTKAPEPTKAPAPTQAPSNDSGYNDSSYSDSGNSGYDDSGNSGYGSSGSDDDSGDSGYDDGES